MHKLLRRQLERLRLSPDAPPTPSDWTRFLENVGRAYEDAARGRYVLEQSLTLSSMEMSELNVALRKKHDELKAIFESAALGILGVDESDRIVEANPAAQRMLGRSTAQLTGRTVDELFDDAAPTSTSRPYAEVLERRYEHPDHGTAWFVSTSNWVGESTAGTRLGTYVLEDITARKHLEVSLRHAQRLESVGRLAAGVAHEINTPIQFVNHNVHFLRDAFGALGTLVSSLHDELEAVGGEAAGRCTEAADAADWSYLREEVPKSIAQTLEGLQRVATIVQSMKAFAHSDHGVQAPADLNAALATALVVAQHELKGVAVASTHFADLPPITCCRSDLNQVFLNLIINAAHAIGDVVAKTGELGRIDVTTRLDGDHVEVEIRDTGGGIPESVGGKVFDPFFTTKDVGKGTGQGLALARTIVVTRHGGSIDFDTELGVGTTFRVRLPIGGVTAVAA